jgi:hypothetical protein
VKIVPWKNIQNRKKNERSITAGSFLHAFVVHDVCNMISVAGPAEEFALADFTLALTEQRSAYQVTLVSRLGGLVGTSSSLFVQTGALTSLSVGFIDTLTVAGGPRVQRVEQEASLLARCAPKCQPASRTTCAIRESVQTEETTAARAPQLGL